MEEVQKDYCSGILRGMGLCLSPDADLDTIVREMSN
jgi:hypothetical protein